MKLDNWYKFKDAHGSTAIGQYLGRCEDFGCCICGKGNNAHCFNIWYCEDNYETWGYGEKHLPKIIEDLGNTKNVIVNK